jgi:hypothetical protein
MPSNRRGPRGPPVPESKASLSFDMRFGSRQPEPAPPPELVRTPSMSSDGPRRGLRPITPSEPLVSTPELTRPYDLDIGAPERAPDPSPSWPPSSSRETTRPRGPSVRESPLREPSVRESPLRESTLRESTRRPSDAPVDTPLRPSLDAGNPSIPFGIPHALYLDLTKPASTKEFPATELSKLLIEYVGLDVVQFRRNHQVAYGIVDHCRRAYDKINGVVEEIDQGADDETNYFKWEKYTGALDGLEE